MEYLPLFHDLRDRRVLVVGGGEVAARKARLLLRAGADVLVVSPLLGPSLSAFCERGEMRHRAQRYRREQLSEVDLVVAATNDQTTNEAVSRDARARRVPVNVVDAPSLCSFIMPAIVDRSPVIVAISTGGTAPLLATALRARIERLLSPGIGRLAVWAGRWRRTIQSRLEPSRRRSFMQRLLAGPAAALIESGHEPEADAWVTEALAGEHPAGSGFVHLVGAGPGAADLLTLRAARLLSQADVLVHDRLVSDEVMELARRDARRIDVGKRPGDHAMRQEQINALLIDLARGGKRVVRLKGGDPLIFGRGGEEAAALAAANVDYEVVPGITAATACAASAGIPLTHRDHASGCIFVTGHSQAGGAGPDWSHLAQTRNTVVIYMGLRELRSISAKLLAHGRSPSTPAAIVERGGTADARVIVGTLADLPARKAACELEGPALIIIGDVVAARAALRSVAREAAAVAA